MSRVAAQAVPSTGPAPMALVCGHCAHPVKNKRSAACESCGKDWRETPASTVEATPSAGVPSTVTEPVGSMGVLDGRPENSAEPPPEVVGPHIAERDGFVTIKNVLMTIKKGQLFGDYPLIKQLLAAGAPIVPCGSEVNLVRCPCCSTLFEPQDNAFAQGQSRGPNER